MNFPLMNMKQTVAFQSEFPFAGDLSIHWAPPINERVMCCTIPEQHEHPEFGGSCYADRVPEWLKPVRSLRKKLSSEGVKPPADTPKSQPASKVGASAPRLNSERPKS
jgi:hypothetical protein